MIRDIAVKSGSTPLEGFFFDQNFQFCFKFFLIDQNFSFKILYYLLKINSLFWRQLVVQPSF